MQVMVEGPRHIPSGSDRTNISCKNAICKGAPFYVLGAAGHGYAAGYDHITSAIGGAIAAMCGRTPVLCYAFGHLAIPDIDDVREGVMACPHCRHAADRQRE